VSSSDRFAPPNLDQLDRLLDEDKLFQAIKTDPSQRHPHTLVVKHLQ
jgi:hypothetical protein